MRSWAVPDQADDAAWERLTREEQLAAYKAHFMSAACCTSTEATVEELVKSSRKPVVGQFEIHPD